MDSKKYICPICGNKDPKSIGIRNGHYYCRKCISFRAKEKEIGSHFPVKAYYHLDYDLSEEQLKLSSTLLNNYKNGINTLVYAVCGAGKTEIVLNVIKYAIECGDTVGFAIPRREVVKEIHERFKNIFTRNRVIAVYGGHNENLYGDLVVFTTHQLYNYNNYFDLLIVDEIDAFPYNGNDVLQSLFKRAIKGRYILMSATPSENIIKDFKKEGKDVVTLFSRFHKYPLPVPQVVIEPKVILYVSLLKLVKDMLAKHLPIFIFVPTIELSYEIFKFLSYRFKRGDYINSKRENKEEILSDFKEGKTTYLVTTAVLERGVTFKNLQVIVMFANHAVYSSYALIQIAGRVGRKKDAPEGKVIFLAEETNKDIERSVSEIERANKDLSNMF